MQVCITTDKGNELIRAGTFQPTLSAVNPGRNSWPYYLMDCSSAQPMRLCPLEPHDTNYSLPAIGVFRGDFGLLAGMTQRSWLNNCNQHLLNSEEFLRWLAVNPHLSAVEPMRIGWEGNCFVTL